MTREEPLSITAQQLEPWMRGTLWPAGRKSDERFREESVWVGDKNWLAERTCYERFGGTDPEYTYEFSVWTGERDGHGYRANVGRAVFRRGTVKWEGASFGYDLTVAEDLDRLEFMTMALTAASAIATDLIEGLEMVPSGNLNREEGNRG